MSEAKPTYEEELNFIRQHLSSWKDVKSEDVTLQRCSFGLSRATYKVTANKEISPNPIILRKFLREAVQPTEAPLFEMMGESGLGPKCHYQDLKFRIEEYLPSRILKASEIMEKDIRRKLAIKLGGIHSLKPNLPSLENKKGYIINILDNPQYMKSCRDNCLAEDVYTEEEKKAVQDLKYLFDEPTLDYVRNKISKLPVVFSHNDVWVGNLLVLDNSNDIVFLDYEVMDWNFPGYDIGKLILEKHYERHPTQPSYELVPLSEFPSDEEIRDFIRYYIVGRNGGREIKDGDVLSGYYSSKEEAEKEVENLLQQTKLGVVISGWYCAHLGLRLGKKFSPTFDLIKFAKDGHVVFRHFKPLLDQ